MSGHFRLFHILVKYLLFLIYINDLPNELKSNVKLFADDTSLFTVVKNKNESVNILYNGLQSISWAYYWKMLFNPGSSKPACTKCYFEEKRTFKSFHQKFSVFRICNFLAVFLI